MSMNSAQFHGIEGKKKKNKAKCNLYESKAPLARAFAISDRNCDEIRLKRIGLCMKATELNRKKACIGVT